MTIPVKGEIQQVVLKTKRMETSIWTADTCETAATERSDVYARLEPSSPEPETPEQPTAPARELSYPMLLGSSEQTVYLDVSDEEILLWDNASGGQLIAVAKYAQAMQGAQDALQSCDFTDLDGDGSSELTAIFRFPQVLSGFTRTGVSSTIRSFPSCPESLPLQANHPSTRLTRLPLCAYNGEKRKRVKHHADETDRHCR